MAASVSIWKPVARRHSSRTLGGIKLYARTDDSRQAAERHDQTGAYPVTHLFYHFGGSRCRLWSMEASHSSVWRAKFTAHKYNRLPIIAYERSLRKSHPRA
jgi:hypothetical protein